MKGGGKGGCGELPERHRLVVEVSGLKNREEWSPCGAVEVTPRAGRTVAGYVGVVIRWLVWPEVELPIGFMEGAGGGGRGVGAPPAGADDSGMELPNGSGGWVVEEGCHPVRHRPRQSRAEQGRGDKVVRPVGRSTLSPRPWPAPRCVGRRQDGRAGMRSRLLWLSVTPL